MWIWAGAIFIAVFILIIILVLLSNIHIEASLETHNSKAEMELRVKLLYGIIRYHYEVPEQRFEEIKMQIAELVKEKINDKRLARQENNKVVEPGDSDTSQQKGEQDEGDEEPDSTNKRGEKGFTYQLEELMKSAYALRIWNTSDFSTIRITKLKWHSKLGTEDVVFTSILTGLAWGIKNMMLGWLSYKVKFADGTDIQVHALWDERWALNTSFEFRAYIRFFRAMKILHMMTRRLTDAHGGLLAWRRDLG